MIGFEGGAVLILLINCKNGAGVDCGCCNNPFVKLKNKYIWDYNFSKHYVSKKPNKYITHFAKFDQFLIVFVVF